MDLSQVAVIIVDVRSTKLVIFACLNDTRKPQLLKNCDILNHLAKNNLEIIRTVI